MPGKNRNIRLCVAGSSNSGKTFLIHALVKLLSRHMLTTNLPFLLETETHDLDANQLKNDIYENIKNGGIGTRHSEEPDLYEFEYHNKLIKKSPGIFEKLFKRKKTSFVIKNIPGEMFETYFRPDQGK